MLELQKVDELADVVAGLICDLPESVGVELVVFEFADLLNPIQHLLGRGLRKLHIEGVVKERLDPAVTSVIRDHDYRDFCLLDYWQESTEASSVGLTTNTIDFVHQDQSFPFRAWSFLHSMMLIKLHQCRFDTQICVRQISQHIFNSLFVTLVACVHLHQVEAEALRNEPDRGCLAEPGRSTNKTGPGIGIVNRPILLPRVQDLLLRHTA